MKATRPTAHCLPPWRRGSEMSDMMSITDMMARLRADAADERFEGARLGPTAVRELLRHIDALRRERDELTARLAEIEQAKPVRGVVLQDGEATLVQPGTELLRVRHCGASRLYTRSAPTWAAASELGSGPSDNQ